METKSCKNEIIMYIIFGVLTTLVNIVVYAVCYKYLSISNIVSNVLAWIISVVFAFITNKFFVFNSKTLNIRKVFDEFVKFVTARLLTGGLDLLIMYIGVDVMAYNSIIMKIISNVIVIILNYVFSKLIVFRK